MVSFQPSTRIAIQYERAAINPELCYRSAYDQSHGQYFQKRVRYQMLAQQHQELSDKIWAVANKLRGPYRPPQYRRVMLPLIVLRRLDCVLEPTKAEVLKQYQALKAFRKRRSRRPWPRSPARAASNRSTTEAPLPSP